jgi:hypothetical protein
VLPPAGRADVAVRCRGASGELRLASGARPGASGEWNGDLYWNPHIATIEVRGDGDGDGDGDGAASPGRYCRFGRK